ncbi:MAG: hypothetical protein VX203_04875, partial [Pseudomonadota bacterium]|nr:hypothetical protein [Pseudomonadota bacterium]
PGRRPDPARLIRPTDPASLSGGAGLGRAQLGQGRKPGSQRRVTQEKDCHVLQSGYITTTSRAAARPVGRAEVAWRR